MRIAIAGAGAVGRSVAQELLEGGHKVLLIERNRAHFEPHTVPAADWLLADACELASLEECRLQTCDVVIAATGDDKANLATALLAKSEFGVPRVVARVNDIRNEWLFTDDWGVDVAVSNPRAMVAVVEGAIDVGHLVPIMGLRRGQANVMKLTLSADSPLIGRRINQLALPDDAALISVLRADAVVLPSSDDVLADGDQVLFVAGATAESQIRASLTGTSNSWIVG